MHGVSELKRLGGEGRREEGESHQAVSLLTKRHRRANPSVASTAAGMDTVNIP